MDKIAALNEILQLDPTNAFARYGHEGVLALFSDSTNVERPGFTGSERNIVPRIEELCRAAPRRVILSCFASSIHRIQQVIDIAGGLLMAGALAAWVPAEFWQSFFGVDHPLLATLWGPIVGPLVAVISFVCSVGNIPLAAVLWNGGISFGGAIAFIFADLIILPILNIYRKYYGLKMAGFLFVTFYAAMAGAALVVELIFGALGLVPAQRNARVAEASFTWDYTTWLNIAFVILAGLLVWRFLRTGGPAMLRMMNRPANHGHARQHAH